jgi:hypothetical protein
VRLSRTLLHKGIGHEDGSVLLLLDAVEVTEVNSSSSSDTLGVITEGTEGQLHSHLVVEVRSVISVVVEGVVGLEGVELSLLGVAVGVGGMEFFILFKIIEIVSSLFPVSLDNALDAMDISAVVPVPDKTEENKPAPNPVNPANAEATTPMAAGPARTPAMVSAPTAATPVAAIATAKLSDASYMSFLYATGAVDFLTITAGAFGVFDVYVGDAVVDLLVDVTFSCVGVGFEEGCSVELVCSTV